MTPTIRIRATLAIGTERGWVSQRCGVCWYWATWGAHTVLITTIFFFFFSRTNWHTIVLRSMMQELERGYRLARCCFTVSPSLQSAKTSIVARFCLSVQRSLPLVRPLAHPSTLRFHTQSPHTPPILPYTALTLVVLFLALACETDPFRHWGGCRTIVFAGFELPSHHPGVPVPLRCAPRS